MVNVPLLRKGLEWVEAEAAKPYAIREWMQAKYVVPKTIDDPLVGPHSLERTTGHDWVADARQGKAEECGTCYCLAGYICSISDVEWNYATASPVAQELLGISTMEAAYLFAGGNTVEDMRRRAEDIAEQKL